MRLDERADDSRIRPGVLAQRPADRVAHEELRAPGVRRTGTEQPVDVGAAVGVELVQQRNADDPGVSALRQHVHPRAELQVSQHERARNVCERVDGVPPGPRRRQPLDLRQEPGRRARRRRPGRFKATLGVAAERVGERHVGHRLPDDLARRGVEGGEVAFTRREVHDALVDERRALELGAGRAVDRLRPGELEVLHVGRVDLVQRRLVLVPEVAAGRQPVGTRVAQQLAAERRSGLDRRR